MLKILLGLLLIGVSIFGVPYFTEVILPKDWTDHWYSVGLGFIITLAVIFPFAGGVALITDGVSNTGGDGL